MNILRKKRTASPGKRRKPHPLFNGAYIVRGEKIEISPIPGQGASEAHLPREGFPTLVALERDYIIKVLSHVRHNKTRAAEILGIDRVSLWRKIKKYEIGGWIHERTSVR